MTLWVYHLGGIITHFLWCLDSCWGPPTGSWWHHSHGTPLLIKVAHQTAACRSSRERKLSSEVLVESFCLPTHARGMRGKEIGIEEKGLMGWKEVPVWGRNWPQCIKKKIKSENLAHSFNWKKDQVYRNHCPPRLSLWCQNPFHPSSQCPEPKSSVFFT